jgi:GAF domain-containing protein
VDSGLMPTRRAAPSFKLPPEPSNAPMGEVLLAALAERERELAEAPEQQSAVAEVLQVINASPGDLAAAFDAIVKRAARLCGADFGGMWIVEGEDVRAVSHGAKLPQPYLEFLTREPWPLKQIYGRALQEQPFVQIADLVETEAYRNGNPATVASVELGGVRTLLAVPLRKDGAVVGIIDLFRQEARPFSERQIALVQSFASGRDRDEEREAHQRGPGGAGAADRDGGHFEGHRRLAC